MQKIVKKDLRIDEVVAKKSSIPKNERTRERPFDEEWQAKIECLCETSTSRTECCWAHSLLRGLLWCVACELPTTSMADQARVYCGNRPRPTRAPSRQDDGNVRAPLLCACLWLAWKVAMVCPGVTPRDSPVLGSTPQAKGSQNFARASETGQKRRDTMKSKI